MIVSLRTPEMEEKYQAYLKTPEAKECCYCREWRNYVENEPTQITKTWRHWVLMPNEFPYNAIYSVNDMLFPKRHVEFEELTINEVLEFYQIKKELSGQYHKFEENLGARKSQPGHAHYHFCKF